MHYSHIQKPLWFIKDLCDSLWTAMCFINDSALIVWICIKPVDLVMSGDESPT